MFPAGCRVAVRRVDSTRIKFQWELHGGRVQLCRGNSTVKVLPLPTLLSSERVPS